MSVQRATAARACDIENERTHLMRFARRRLSDVHAAEDAVQDTLLVALTSLGSTGGFMGRSSLRTWLTAILHHKVMDVYRRNASEARVRDSGADVDAVTTTQQPAATDDPVCQLEQKQLSATLLSAIDELPSRQRDVFVLYQMQGCSGDEIAKRVGLSSNNVWVILHRARHALRARLQGADAHRHFGHRHTQPPMTSMIPIAHGFSHA